MRIEVEVAENGYSVTIIEGIVEKFICKNKKELFQLLEERLPNRPKPTKATDGLKFG